MTPGDVAALLLIISSHLVQAAASNAQPNAATITPRAELKPRQDDQDLKRIGYREFDGKKFVPWSCSGGQIFWGFKNYAGCFTPGQESYALATTCSHGTIFWPDGSTSSCGQNSCATAKIGGLLDLLDVKTPTPTLTMVYCDVPKSTTWTAWSAIMHAKSISGTDGLETYEAIDRASLITKTTTSDPSTMSTTSDPSTNLTLSTNSTLSATHSPIPTESQRAPQPSRLSTGDIVGIAISASFVVIGVAFGGFRLYKSRKERKEATAGLGKEHIHHQS